MAGSSLEWVDWSQVSPLSSDLPLSAAHHPPVVLTSLDLSFLICSIGMIKKSAQGEGVWSRGQQTWSVESQIVNIFNSVGHKVFVAAAWKQSQMLKTCARLFQ